jgi:hypothetical protein
MTAVSTESDWMSLKEVKLALECSGATVRVLVARGEIRYHPHPGYRRYLRHDVARIVADRESSKREEATSKP